MKATRFPFYHFLVTIPLVLPAPNALLSRGAELFVHRTFLRSRSQEDPGYRNSHDRREPPSSFLDLT